MTLTLRDLKKLFNEIPEYELDTPVRFHLGTYETLFDHNVGIVVNVDFIDDEALVSINTHKKSSPQGK